MNKDLYRQNILTFYNAEAQLRDSRSVKADWKVFVRDKFLKAVQTENKKTLLELGAGPGHDSLFFVENGLKVTAVDLSEKMTEKCREKGLEAYALDFYDLSSLNKRYSCVYAINTLLHVPKEDLCHVLHQINLVLEADGLFYMGLYGGQDTQSEYVISEISDAPRYFVFHSAQYLTSVLSQTFIILDFLTLNVGTGGVQAPGDIFHSVTMRKKA